MRDNAFISYKLCFVLTIVAPRINETRQTGAVENRTYRGAKWQLTLFQQNHLPGISFPLEL